MNAIHTIHMVTGPTLSIAVPAELHGKRVEVIVTALVDEQTNETAAFKAKLAAMTLEKPKLSPEWERRLAEDPTLMERSVLRYDDPFGPACPPEDWEALS